LTAADEERVVIAGSALFGGALGLALLTKSTAFLFAPPLLVWFVWSLVRRAAARFGRPALWAAMVALCINAGWFSRNHRTFGSPFGDQEFIRAHANAAWGPKIAVSNLLRNLAVHANVPFPGATESATTMVRRIHGLLGADPDDPRITHPGVEFRVHGPFHFEDVAGCGGHVLLIALAFTLCWRPSNARPWLPRTYAAVWAIAFLVFCCYLRWQPWSARLQLPLFVLFSPLIGTVCSLRLSARVGRALSVLLLIAGLPYLVFNQSRSLVGRRNLFTMSRRELMFYNRPHLQGPYERVVHDLAAARCDRIGLVMGVDDWEYPLWSIMRDSMPAGFVVRHNHVANASSMHDAPSTGVGSHPCRMVKWDAEGRPRLMAAAPGTTQPKLSSHDRPPSSLTHEPRNKVQADSDQVQIPKPADHAAVFAEAPEDGA
jgi:hypothetical protein